MQRRHIRNVWKLLYLVLLISVIVLSWAFASTDGFVYGTTSDGKPLYTHDLQSSGSNDDLSIAAGSVLFGVPLAFRLFGMLRNRGIGVAEITVFTLVWVYQAFLIVMLDAGNLIQTASKNVVLVLWLFAFFAIAPVFGWVATIERN